MEAKGAGQIHFVSKSFEKTSVCENKGCGKTYEGGNGYGKPELPELPQTLAPVETAVGRYTTVFAEGFDYEVSENLCIEYFDSIGGCLANREDALSAVN